LGNKKGNAVIPPIKFSYFNTQKGDYETIATDSIKLAFSAPVAHVTIVENGNAEYWWIAGCIAVLALLFLILIITKYRQKSKKLSKKKEDLIQTNAENTINTPVSSHDEEAIALEKKERLRETLLDLELENGNEHQFFVLAKALVIQYLQDELHTTSSNEQELLQQLQTKNPVKAAEVADIFARCNKALYMPVVPATEQTEILKKMKLLIG
jgi:hypothetical protein